MDPPRVNEASFTAEYSLAEIWQFPMIWREAAGGELGGLGLSFGGFGRDVAAGNYGDLSVEESTVTEQSGNRRGGGGGGRKKRKDANSEDESSKLVSSRSANDLKEDSNTKRTKRSRPNDEGNGSKAETELSVKDGSKPTEQCSKPEPPKDYIHVRARRGQATDSHSLAERARREKISERMKFLQDLVPGCNKIIGKALVLDEIINYVLSLQRQVELLSMKLEAVDARVNPAVEHFPPKDLTIPSDATGMMFGSEAPRDYYTHGTQHEWLHMQIGSSFDGQHD